MRILHVNKFLYRRGGAEAYMQDVAARQTADGHDVAFFGMSHPANPEVPYAEWFPSQLELDPAPASLGERMRVAGRVLWSRSARDGMDRVVESFRPDVVHLHNIYHHLSPSVLRPLARRRLPAVMTLHDYKLVCPVYACFSHGAVCDECVGRRFHRCVLNACKDGSRPASALLAFELGVHTYLGAYDPVRLFVCPSRFLAGKMRDGGVYPERLRVLNNFVDVDTTRVRRSRGSGVVYVGRLSPEKGVDVLVRAAGRLPDGVPVTVVGDGPQRAELEELADRESPGRVEFLGRRTKDEVQEIARRSTVAVLPSRCFENQPLWVLEAYSSGLPVVASDLGGIPEVVSHGVTGVLVPPNDPDAVAKAVIDLVGDPVAATAMGEAGRALVEDHFSPERHLSQLHDLYAEAGAPVG